MSGARVQRSAHTAKRPNNDCAKNEAGGVCRREPGGILIEETEVIPPNALDAEIAILSAILLDPKKLADVSPILQPRHFWNHANGLIFGSMIECFAAGQAIDTVSLKHILQGKGALQKVGGPAYLLKILQDDTPPGNAAQHAKLVRDKSRLRDLRSTLLRMAEQTMQVNGATDQFLADAGLELSTLTKSTEPTRDRFAWIETEELYQPLPLIPWVCKRLCIGPGRPTLIAGYGFSGKSLVLQAMAVAIASGVPIWGEFDCVAGVVRHIDLEQGKHATLRRYQRLIVGTNTAKSSLGGRLKVSILPNAYLTDPAIEGVLMAVCADTAVCIIDSFRAAIPGLDENDSAVRQALDILTRVSEATGCAFIVIHHAGKNGKEKGRKETPRGSSAIFDACGTVLGLTCDEPFGPIKVELLKASASAEGSVAEAFWIRPEDIASDDGGDMRAGLRITYSEEDPNVERDPTETPETSGAARDRVLQVVRRFDTLSSANAIYREAKGDRNATLEAVKDMIRDKVLVKVKGAFRVAADMTHAEPMMPQDRMDMIKRVVFGLIKETPGMKSVAVKKLTTLPKGDVDAGISILEAEKAIEKKDQGWYPC